MKSKLTTALTLLLALVFVVSSFAGCANGGEGIRFRCDRQRQRNQ